jgi:hypothetical protein
MTLKAWGHADVSCALDVYNLLTAPPADHDRWRELLTLEPPFWGAIMDYACAVAYLIGRGNRVWSWDAEGVVLSDAAHVPPHGVRYRHWNHYFHEREDEPTQPYPRPSADPTAEDHQQPGCNSPSRGSE